MKLTVRDLLGDDVTRDEYLLSLGFGGAFGAGFKGSLEGLSGIFNKVKGKTCSRSRCNIN